MLRIKIIRFLSLKDSKMTGVEKVNVLEQFCERKGVKENWRKDVEKEIELVTKKKNGKIQEREN